jgi:hypothetical protein
VGNKAVEGASQKVGEDVWNKAKAIWAKLHPTFRTSKVAQKTTELFSDMPK